MDDLIEDLEAIAANLNDWDHPINARETLQKAIQVIRTHARSSSAIHALGGIEQAERLATAPRMYWLADNPESPIVPGTDPGEDLISNAFGGSDPVEYLAAISLPSQWWACVNNTPLGPFATEAECEAAEAAKEQADDRRS